jgi:hypothetical protein
MRTGTIMMGAALMALVLGAGLPAVAQTQAAANPASTRGMMSTVQPGINFTDVTLSQAIDFLRQSTGANIVVDWPALQAANVNRDTLINVRLQNVTFRTALNIILSEAGAGNLLTFYVQDNVLTITTQAKADAILYTIVYPVQDLLVSTPNFSLQDVSSLFSSISSSNSSTTIGAGATGAGSSLNNTGGSAFGQSSMNNNQSTQETPQQQGADLVTLITTIVRPSIWRQNGGPATIMFFHGDLIVTAPRSVQEAIGGPIP